MKYRVRLEWMEEVTPTGFSPAWMVQGDVEHAAEPREFETTVEARTMREAIEKAAEKAGVALPDVARIVVNGHIIRGSKK